jgi:cation diffusion facilitator family transporter
VKSERTADLLKVRGILTTVFVINVVLSVLKLIWGFYTHTLSLTAEGFHSLLDSSANAVAILGLTISMKPADEGHPYGHRKFEAISAIAISFFMFLASFEVLQQIVERLSASQSQAPVVGPVSFAVVLLNLVVALAISKWEARRGKELSSSLLLADSKHTLSDLWSTVAVLVSLISIALNIHFIDTVASVFIVAIILHSGWEVIMSHLGPLVDSVMVKVEDVEKEVLAVEGVVSCHKIRSRGMQDHIFLDLHVQVPRHLTIEEAHNISFAVEDKLKKWDGRIFEVLVHLEDDSPPRLPA